MSKTKKYRVVIHYEGSISYTVSAKSEDEAEMLAEELFEDESNNRIAENIGDVYTCDCWEEDGK